MNDKKQPTIIKILSLAQKQKHLDKIIDLAFKRC